MFGEPHTLPPAWVYNHTIPLVLGAVNVNSRPYWYSPHHKDEIEHQVKELLTAGLISPILNPFASPVLVQKKKRWLLEVLRRLSTCELIDNQESFSHACRGQDLG